MRGTPVKGRGRLRRRQCCSIHRYHRRTTLWRWSGCTSGFVLMVARDFNTAIVHLQQVLQAHPDSSFAHEYLALSYAGQGRYSEALAEYRKFIAVDRPYPFIRALMAHAYASSGKRTEALALLHDLETDKAYV